MNNLLCILLFSLATGCASVEHNSQSTASTFESPMVNPWSIQTFKPWAKGPHPTVIVGHGCDGLRNNPALLDWARELNSWGYNAVFYDSFENKGISGGICTDPLRVLPEYRAREADTVAKWIKEQPWHTGKIGYIGISHGGSTALRIAKANNPESNINAVIAYYPSCHVHVLGSATLNKKSEKPDWGIFMNLPTQVHLASDDDWTPAWECKDLKNVEVYEYDKTTHAFDLSYPDRIFSGHKLKYNIKATALSRERSKKFLSENL
jgi:dienelactone hydrolase